MMSNSTGAAADWDPYNPEYFRNPYPMYKRLREEAPIYYNEKYGFFAVSRYDDVQAVLGDRDTYISSRGVLLEHVKGNFPMPRGMFIGEDPPLHTIHRGVLTRVFTPKKMAALEAEIRAYCARALDPLQDGGVFDFVGDLGAEMPIRVIGMLLGIPEEDLKGVQAYVDNSMTAETGKPIDIAGQDLTGEYFADYIDWRAKNPSDDLMTELLRSEIVDENGVKRTLTREETMVMINILAGAGNETTNRLIGWTGKLLAEHPDQRRQIYENRALIPQTVEEILRVEPPPHAVARYVARDAEFYGVKVPAGSAMMALVAAGNRDERKFANGEAFDIHRERVPHLTFGFGFHNCLGNALARVEGRAALDEILTRFPEWDVDLDNAHLSPNPATRGWDTMPAYTPKAKGKARPAPKPAAAAPAPAPAGAEVWTLTMKSPTGPEQMTAYLVRDGATLSGRVDSRMGSEPIKNGKIDGDALSWALDIKQPMPITLKFEVKAQGDVMSGAAKLGMFGSAELSGQRQAAH
jgi:cytochrome P450